MCHLAPGRPSVRQPWTSWWTAHFRLLSKLGTASGSLKHSRTTLNVPFQHSCFRHCCSWFAVPNMLGQQLRTLQQSHAFQQQHVVLSSGSCCRQRSSRTRSAAVACRGTAATAPGALILEADGVVADLHMDGHRVAFNRAFHDLGFDCANWTPAIYHDLLAKGDGTGEGLVAAYYVIVGWPTFLPTNEQSIFAGKVHELKQKQLRKMLDKGQLPLRDGVKQVLRDAAAAAGTKIALISQTCSDPQDDVITCIMTQLPTEVRNNITVYPAATYSQQEVTDNTHGTNDNVTDANNTVLDPSASLAAAAGRVKQRGAQEFVERLTSALEGKSKAVPVQLDLSLQSTGKHDWQHLH
eukprot:GHUV01006757.1.p1 GENE.GHUV01006757.1~~GHUV01006757.1.p1  ORF type:complete len:352 (+),score=73.34 GHUV01006757.1:1317-2372(+)